MKLNNCLNQNKYTISIDGSAVGAGVSAEAWTTSSAPPVATTSASFS